MHKLKIHKILLMKILKILRASKKPNSTTLKTNLKLLKVVSDTKMIVKKLRLFWSESTNHFLMMSGMITGMTTGITKHLIFLSKEKTLLLHHVISFFSLSLFSIFLLILVISVLFWTWNLVKNFTSLIMKHYFII